MKESECKCFVMICSSEDDIRKQSHKFVEYMGIKRSYTGKIVKKHFNGDLRLEFDTGEEIHFVLKQEFKRWSTGRIYRVIEPLTIFILSHRLRQEAENGNSTDNSI